MTGKMDNTSDKIIKGLEETYKKMVEFKKHHHYYPTRIQRRPRSYLSIHSSWIPANNGKE